MTRRVLYVAHCLRPSEEEVAAYRARWDAAQQGRLPSEVQGQPSERAVGDAVIRANLDHAMTWLSWLRRSFPETTFIAPWIASVLAGADDADPAQREAGFTDACAVIERCDGIVLCGPRISNGMGGEMEHGRLFVHAGHAPFGIYDLTGYQIEGASGRNEDRRTFEQWMLGYQESCTR